MAEPKRDCHMEKDGILHYQLENSQQNEHAANRDANRDAKRVAQHVCTCASDRENYRNGDHQE